MKLLAIVLAAAGLSGCLAYPSPYGVATYPGQGAYYGQGAYAVPGGYAQPYVVEPTISIYGTTGYHGRVDHGRRYRDQDRDGIPNRIDRDRDGDGVRNHVDRRPRDPHRH